MERSATLRLNLPTECEDGPCYTWRGRGGRYPIGDPIAWLLRPDATTTVDTLGPDSKHVDQEETHHKFEDARLADGV